MKKTLITVGFLVLSTCGGCGTNINEALVLAAESGTRTFVDILVSDLVSELPNLFNLPPGGSTDGTGDGDGNGDGNGGGDGEPADPGAQLFTSNSCGACHCADASGGCFPGAPALQGVDATTLAEWLQGNTPHTGGKFPDLSEQDLADLEAYLATVGG